MKDDLGDRIKGNYEDRTRIQLPRRTNTIIRIDGKAFHTYTRKLEKPYDMGLVADMEETMNALVRHIQGAKLGYVQSDEISILVTDYDAQETDAWFDGNIQKMCSISASAAAAHFNALRFERTKKQSIAMFDARVFTIPDATEVANYFLWRAKDAARNSVQMYARSLFSHKQLHGKSVEAIHQMIKDAGNPAWHDQPQLVRHGIFTCRTITGWQSVPAPEPTFANWHQTIKAVLPI